ncbi:MAG TPA: peptide deformylase [Candidatus Paceibacterota bacterium]|nr:peptide deformylase [Candidatus Paceibacterota bacterium]
MSSTLNRAAFVPPDSPILLQVAEPVTPQYMVSSSCAFAIKSLWRIAFGEQKIISKPLLVGLAAPQVGISRRIILVDVAADGKGKVGDLRLYINPEIISTSPEKSEWYEGCFSTSCVCGIVARHDRIKIRALDINGNLIEEEHSGYTARIFQHEIDHLDGKEFTVHITDDEKLHWVEPDQFPLYRNQGAWRNWPYKCTRARWMAIKNPK